MRIGEPVGDVTLPDDEGGTWSLREHRGAPVLLVLHRHLA